MNTVKRYPHLENEEYRLREICLAQLDAEYGADIPADVTERLENELNSIAGCNLSGVMLILREMIVRSGLKRYELIAAGPFGASLVLWLCGLTPFDPLKTLLPFYPEFCYSFHWDKELGLSFYVPTGKAEELFGIIKRSEGVGDVISVDGREGSPKRVIIPEGEEKKDGCCYCEVCIAENSHLRLLKALADYTCTDPEEISLEDRDVFELFRHSDHPACIEISPFRLTAVGLMGLLHDYELEFYGNINIDLDSFTDLVRIHSLAHSSGAWEYNQSRWVYEEGLPLSELITCREDVYEYCRNNLGLSREEAFIAAERVRKGRGFPYELRENAEGKSQDWVYENMPVRFDSFCSNVSYLFPRVHSYCFMALAWRCAWYRLHYPLEFYYAYFKTVADPQVADAVFSGRDAYDKLTPRDIDEECLEDDEDFQYNLNLAVADEMYLRGIDPANTYTIGSVSNAVLELRDSLLPGQVTVLAGRPGMGKTALACDLISISFRRFGAMPGYLAENEDAEAVVKRIAARGNSPCIVFPSLEAFGLFDLQAVPTPLLVIDYIPYDPDESLRDFFETIKAFAQKRRSHVLIVSQVSREADGREDKRPRLSDLPMQDCLDLIDNVVFLYREDRYTNGNTGEAEAIFAKSPLGEKTIRLRWDSTRATFLYEDQWQLYSPVHIPV